MKRILLISDTHGLIDPAVERHAKSADELWHAGDIGNEKVADFLTNLKPLRAVYGNIDGTELRSRFKEELVFELEGVKVVMTHIAGYPGSWNAKAKLLIQQHQPKLFIAGHSHILKVLNDKHNQLLFMNPGAAGNHGFHRVKTMLKFDLDNGRIENLQLIEIGSRSSLDN